MKSILSTVEILTEDELQQIHEATLTVLAEVGGCMPHPRVLAALAETGAQVDFDSGLVRLPRAVAEAALAAAPRHEPYFEQQREGGRIFFRRGGFHAGPGNEANIVDYRGTARRQGTVEDVLRGIVLCNQLPHIDSCMPLVTPSDVPGPLGDVVGYYLCALYSVKPFSVYLSDLPSALAVLRMKAALRDEPARAGDDPQVSYLLEPNGSLSFNTPGLEIALAFADAGQRISIGPMVMAGLDAPFSLAGALVIQNAENLLGLAMCRALGLPGGWSPVMHTIDPRSTICAFGAPNMLLLQLGGMQMGRWYGFQNFWLNLGLTDSPLPDFQGGFEKGAGAMLALLAGAAGVGAQGIVGADQATSLEQLVIDNEWAGYIDHVFRSGFPVDADSLAVDVIRAVGVGGSYLGEPHTARHVRSNHWRSKLFYAGSWDAWMAAGGDDIETRAHAVVQGLLAANYPPGLVVSPETARALEQILLETKEVMAPDAADDWYRTIPLQPQKI